MCLPFHVQVEERVSPPAGITIFLQACHESAVELTEGTRGQATMLARVLESLANDVGAPRVEDASQDLW